MLLILYFISLKMLKVFIAYLNSKWVTMYARHVLQSTQKRWILRISLKCIFFTVDVILTARCQFNQRFK
jgi:hypothetical protein